MSSQVRDVMTPEPMTVPDSAPLPQVAAIMRDHAIGDVVVVEPNRTVVGILTDRDMVVRGLTASAAPEGITAGEVCTRDLETIAASENIGAAVETMRQRAIRRLPVTDDGELVGILSIGDLAAERDPNSALADISAAPPNN